jgi:hypothetical protein
LIHAVPKEILIAHISPLLVGPVIDFTRYTLPIGLEIAKAIKNLP